MGCGVISKSESGVYEALEPFDLIEYCYVSFGFLLCLIVSVQNNRSIRKTKYSIFYPQILEMRSKNKGYVTKPCCGPPDQV